MQSSPRVANMARMGELVGFCKFQGLYHILTGKYYSARNACVHYMYIE